jgi:hypothetical protein
LFHAVQIVTRVPKSSAFRTFFSLFVQVAGSVGCASANALGFWNIPTSFAAVLFGTSRRQILLFVNLMCPARLLSYRANRSTEGRWRKCWNNFLRAYFWIFSCLLANQLSERGSLRAIEAVSQFVQPVEAFLRV